MWHHRQAAGKAVRDVAAERRRRLAEPDLEFRAFCTRKGLPASSTLQLERAWDAWQAERYQRGETGQWPEPLPSPSWRVLVGERHRFLRTGVRPSAQYRYPATDPNCAAN
jgi:hypothetical protein